VINPTYYIYLHRRNDNGEVFYVGKGTYTKTHRYDRAFYTKKRNNIWVNITDKTDYTVELFATFFNESDCFFMEKELISLHGRKADGGTLCNLTEGGEGHTGYSPTQETREKLRALVANGKHPNLGKKLSAETCAKKSASMKASDKNLKGKSLPQWWKDKIAATKVGSDNPMFGNCGIKHPNSKPVIHIHTGIFFESITEAANWQGIKVGTLYNMLKGINKNRTPLEFA
jgi:hypothetical protein